MFNKVSEMKKMDEQVVDKRVYKTLMRIEKGIIKLLENKSYN